MQDSCHFIIDAKNISPATLRSVPIIGDYINKMCQHLSLTPTNSFFIEKFGGGGEGITAAQCLSESLLSLHTYPESGAIYIDIFSCKPFDTLKAISLTGQFFGTKTMFGQKVNRLACSPLDFTSN